jgi:hypothetical protein
VISSNNGIGWNDSILGVQTNCKKKTKSKNEIFHKILILNK